MALVTVLATQGSAPLPAGSRMVVNAGGIVAGSVGGGALEFQAIKQAVAILDHAPGEWRVQDYPLGPLLGQCCGGKVRLLVERLDPQASGWLADVMPGGAVRHVFAARAIERRAAPIAVQTPVSARDPKPVAGFGYTEIFGEVPRPVLLFGAGHVGAALVRVLKPLPFALDWYDCRGEFSRDGVVIAGEEALLAAVAGACDKAAVLIVTHDHALDYRLAEAALGRDFALVGVIGSATKRARFLSRLALAGLGEAARARLVCPIGLPQIRGKDPAVIAIAVAGQLLSLPADDGAC